MHRFNTFSVCFKTLELFTSNLGSSDNGFLSLKKSELYCVMLYLIVNMLFLCYFVQRLHPVVHNIETKIAIILF